MNGNIQLNNRKPRGFGDSNGHTRWVHLARLMYPGIGLKRWLVLGSFGIALCSIGAAYLMRKIFALTLPDFLPVHSEGILLLAMGLLVIALSVYGLYRSLGPLLLASATMGHLAETIYARRSRGRGPRIVAIGGGTGLSVLLRGLKGYTDNLTAIVTVADDGGSSGRLREELGVPPPGDFRNCLVALSEAEPLVTELFQYRFDEGNGLKGHSFGNLFLVAMANVTGSFEQALYESSKVLAVRGQILPATMSSLKLVARYDDGSIVRGESSIGEHRGHIEEISIEPFDAPAHPAAIEAIRLAQVIVIGPGSLYTSVLPNLLVPGISEAIEKSDAARVYVCNVATQVGETGDYTLADHIEALQRHTSSEIVDYAVANSNPKELGPQFLGEPVINDGSPLRHVRLIEADLTDASHPVRHSPTRLAQAILDICQQRRDGRPPISLKARNTASTEALTY